ncbi:MAG: esterase family protein [Clostridia bacterium]|nr:esterase family protein [Clostridia bacterium]
MIFNTLRFYSEALGMQTEVLVLLPQVGTAGEIGVDSGARSGPFKCLYLLHGLSDDQTIWMRRTSIERYAEAYGIAVVMPCGGRSFYTDMKKGQNYYTFVAKELPARICDTFNISAARRDNYIAGLSMGGYGALKIGLRECARFSKIAAFSACADIEDVRGVFDPDGAIFGESDKVDAGDDLFLLADKYKDSELRPDVFMGVGTEDFLYDANKRLCAHFRDLGYNICWRDSHGNHEWAFWDVYVRFALEWIFGRGD